MITQGLVLPQRLEIDNTTLTDRYGRFVAEPFEKGYGHTIGNSLRRILLSSLEGAAVTAVRIKGAHHEFTALKGVREDVIHIILNLKKLRVKLYSAGPETLHLKIRRQGEILAKDIQPNNQVEILTPDLVIANIDDGVELDLEMEISKGRGYIPADRLKREGQPLGTIPVDALFSPVSKVHYEVENARVGQMTDYDKLIVEIWTDGSVTPGDALAYSAKILKDSLTTFITFDEQEVAPVQAQVRTEETAKIEEMLTQPVEIIELSVRASNCLKVAKIKTIGELVSKTEDELLAYKNFGKKSLDEIRDRLKEMGLSLGRPSNQPAPTGTPAGV
ncbi:MAG: DNA-directed RNA polymerase subunit alpha [Elusimicrobia bacterium]|nr:DNA-directed RNA polymerase subunit alpha [Elusimicrobiota bacterium]